MNEDVLVYWNQAVLWVESRTPQFWRQLNAFLILMGFLLAFSAVNRKSVTVDEFQALPSGLAVWKTGDFRYPLGTPPLSQLLPSIPLLFTEALVKPVEGPTANWAVAHQFGDDNAEKFHGYFFLGRLISALIFGFTLVLTYLLAQHLYGERGATLALLCACLNPSLLGHAALITPDVYLACALLGFLLCLEFYRRKPSIPAACLLGFTIGLSCLVKLTGLWLFFLAPFLLAIFHDKQRSKKIAVWILHLSLVFGVAILLINAGYLFQESLGSSSSFHPEAAILQRFFSILPDWLPIPVPLQFLRVMDQQLSETPYVAYLFGETNLHGFFSYYLVGLLVKTPPALLFLSALAWFHHRKLGRNEIPLVLLAVFFFCFFSFARYKNIGFRYLLFLYPLLAIWVGRLAIYAQKPVLIALACGSLVFSGVSSWPNYLSYFNAPSGGTLGGHRYLLDSNLDWGQDLTTLKDFMTERGIGSLDLAHFGHVSPSLYGIKFHTLNGPPSQRFVAISANFLWGRSYFVNGTSFYPEHLNSYLAFRSFDPEAILGGTIYVYDMEKVRASVEKSAP